MGGDRELNHAPPRGRVFRYESHVIDAKAGRLRCFYSLDRNRFEESYTLAPGENWECAEVEAAARMLFLLAGVSYYKTAAPPVIDASSFELTATELSLLRAFYFHGLGEFAYRNRLDLRGVELRSAQNVSPISYSAPLPRPVKAISVSSILMPFGGGIDSIVTAESLRRSVDVTLLIVHREGDRFDGIESSAALSGLPVVRVGRAIDPQLLASGPLGYFRGHVPVTGIISAAAVLAAALNGQDSVVMSNERSASVPTLTYNAFDVNHQWSKSLNFEILFRSALADAQVRQPDYFSALRDRTELWIARQFSRLTQYHSTFRSCNKSFRTDAMRRYSHWCGTCDKCCFTNLILAPFVAAETLRSVFAPLPEPLSNPVLSGRFGALVGEGLKPFECVGEAEECRAAVLLAARRPDRAANVLLQELAAVIAQQPDVLSDGELSAMFHPAGVSLLPDTLSLDAA